jgi:hypothetical protein
MRTTAAWKYGGASDAVVSGITVDTAHLLWMHWQAMTKVVDLDKLLSQLVMTPQTASPRSARQVLQAVIDLKQLLEQVACRAGSPPLCAESPVL